MSEFYKEIEIQAKEKVSHDGKFYRVEDWFDCDMQIFCRTVFYLVQGREDWDEKKHLEFFNNHGLLKDQQENYKKSGLGIGKTEEDRLNLWSLTAVIGDG